MSWCIYFCRETKKVILQEYHSTEVLQTIQKQILENGKSVYYQVFIYEVSQQGNACHHV